MLSIVYISFALFAAACFYASVPHQRLWPRRPNLKGALRAVGLLLCLFALGVAALALGFWSGLFAALTALMLGCVLLPYIDAWRSPGGRADVG